MTTSGGWLDDMTFVLRVRGSSSHHGQARPDPENDRHCGGWDYFRVVILTEASGNKARVNVKVKVRQRHPTSFGIGRWRGHHAQKKEKKTSLRRIPTLIFLCIS